MIKLIRHIVLFLGLPLLLLIFCYLVTDPFKNQRPFSLQNFSPVNREYVSTQLYLKNKSKTDYNAFVFGSSRACGLNTYYWKSKLDGTTRQFLFQSWSESITGIYQKINFLDKNNQRIDDALVLIDVNSSFNADQESTNAITMKDYRLSGKPYLYNQFYFFLSYLKPSAVFKSIKEKMQHRLEIVTFDTITNDWIASNKDNWKIRPTQNMQYNKEKFNLVHIKNIENKAMISNDKRKILLKIKNVFDKRKTSYKILICPEYAQTRINHNDLLILQSVFGKSNVFDFSGKNKISVDKYNFMDTGHFDLCAGYEMIDSIYNQKTR